MIGRGSGQPSAQPFPPFCPGSGRLHLRLKWWQEALACSLGHVDVDRFAAALRQLDGITRVAFNNLSLCCTIDDDLARIPPEAWQDLGLPAEQAQLLRAWRGTLEPWHHLGA